MDKAQEEHDYFTGVMRERGVEVFYVQQLLAEALDADAAAKRTIVERTVTEYTVGWSLVDEMREYMLQMDGATLAKHLIGGLTKSELNLDWGHLNKVSALAAASDEDTFVLPPLPNTLFTRDSSCWIYNGVSINPMYWPARRLEAINVAGGLPGSTPCSRAPTLNFGIHPWVMTSRFDVSDFGRAALEGGDVMPIGNKTVLIGMSERSTGRMIEQIAKALFAKGSAERVIVCAMTKDRAHMHLDTVFTFLDRDAVTIFPSVVHTITAYSIRPGNREGDFDVTVEKDFLSAVADALKVKTIAHHPDRR